LDLKCLLLASATALALCAGAANAATLNFAFLPIDSFSGTPAAGSLNVSFVDNTSIGGVDMTITSNLAPGENIDPKDGLFLNFNPAKNVSLLTFSMTSDTGGTSGAFNNALKAQNTYKPDGDGYMDIELTYNSGSLKAFQGGETEVYHIAGLAGLTATDFDFFSDCSQGCGSGSHLAAFHIQNTPNGGSGSDWDGAEIPGCTGPNCGRSVAPEPASIALLGVGLLGLGMIRRHKNA
jgi:hypothetical protein